jgi:hypothetical protein
VGGHQRPRPRLRHRRGLIVWTAAWLSVAASARALPFWQMSSDEHGRGENSRKEAIPPKYPETLVRNIPQCLHQAEGY